MTIPLTAQWFLLFYIANIVGSAAIQSMPVPSGKNAFYAFLYKFLSLLIADFKSFSSNLPLPKITPLQNPEPKPENTNTGLL